MEEYSPDNGGLVQNSVLQNSVLNDENERTSLKSLIEPERRASGLNENTSRSSGLSLTRIYGVFKEIIVPALSVMNVFMVTIGLFPGLTVFIRSTEYCKTEQRFYNDMFIPFLFFLFNFCDLVGRLCAEKLPPIFTNKNIWILSAARWIFGPLFLLSNISGSRFPVVFRSDFFPLIFMMLFSFTSGYVASTCMMMGPTMVKTEDKSIAGTIMILCLTVGLLLGALTSFVVVYISQGKV